MISSFLLIGANTCPAKIEILNITSKNMSNVVLCVDNGITGYCFLKATIAAFQLLTSSPEVSKQKDKIFVVNVVTAFDVLNEEKNAGNLALAEWGGCLRQLGYNISTTQIECFNTNSTLVSFIQEIGAKHVFIGETSFSSVSEDSNILLSVFSSVKRKIQGLTADYLAYWLDPSVCKVHIGKERFIDILDKQSVLSDDEKLARAIKLALCTDKLLRNLQRFHIDVRSDANYLDHDIIQRPVKITEEKNENRVETNEEFKEEEI